MVVLQCRAERKEAAFKFLVERLHSKSTLATLVTPGPAKAGSDIAQLAKIKGREKFPLRLSDAATFFAGAEQL